MTYRPPQVTEREPDGTWENCAARPRRANGTFEAEPVWERLFRSRRIEGECWIWTGAVRARGSNGTGEPYGGVRYGDRPWLVHRLAWTLVHGPIPPRAMIDHGCHRTLCFRPEHLSPVSAKENSAGRDQTLVAAALDQGRRTRWGGVGHV